MEENKLSVKAKVSGFEKLIFKTLLALLLIKTQELAWRKNFYALTRF